MKKFDKKYLSIRYIIMIVVLLSITLCLVNIRLISRDFSWHLINENSVFFEEYNNINFENEIQSLPSYDNLIYAKRQIDYPSLKSKDIIIGACETQIYNEVFFDECDINLLSGEMLSSNVCNDPEYLEVLVLGFYDLDIDILEDIELDFVDENDEILLSLKAKVVGRINPSFYRPDRYSYTDMIFIQDINGLLEDNNLLLYQSREYDMFIEESDNITQLRNDFAELGYVYDQSYILNDSIDENVRLYKAFYYTIVIILFILLLIYNYRSITKFMNSDSILSLKLKIVNIVIGDIIFIGLYLIFLLFIQIFYLNYDTIIYSIVFAFLIALDSFIYILMKYWRKINDTNY